ncbi:hypothetical protein EXIGLDRAFT_755852, partial [Exidia glandulosa HHB12029]
MSGAADKLERTDRTVRELFPQVVNALESRLLAAVEGNSNSNAHASSSTPTHPTSPTAAAHQPTSSTHALLPAVVNALDSRLLASLSGTGAPNHAATTPTTSATDPPSFQLPPSAPQRSGPSPDRQLSESPAQSMDSHSPRTGTSTLQAPAPTIVTIPEHAALSSQQHPPRPPSSHEGHPPPPTPAKERSSMHMMSPSEKDVTDARMMPYPHPPPQPMSMYSGLPSPNPGHAYYSGLPSPQPGANGNGNGNSYMTAGTGSWNNGNGNGNAPPMRQTSVNYASRPPTSRRASQVDWIVPTATASTLRERDTVTRRLGFTIEVAKKRQASMEAKAKLMGRSLNAAIGLQIVVGALITGLAAVTTGRQTSIMTSVLGALSTIIGSYLARMRGTAEPDLSKSRAKGWERFLRSCEVNADGYQAYLVDHGEEPARDHIDRINEYRQEFEELEGSANAEQKGNHV